MLESHLGGTKSSGGRTLPAIRIDVLNGFDHGTLRRTIAFGEPGALPNPTGLGPPAGPFLLALMICGGAGDHEVFARDERDDLIFTDPPYNGRLTGHVTVLGREL